MVANASKKLKARKKRKKIPKHAIRFLREGDLEIGSGFFETLENLRKEECIDIAKMRRQFLRRMQKGIMTYVILVGGDIVATTSVIFEPKFIHNAGWIAHAEDVATRKGYEGLGFATELLDRIIRLARRKGCYKLILDCSFQNTPFYLKQGMRPVEVCMRIDL